MAHPIVDKLQNFGIRHGEKVGVAVVSALCMLMLWVAASRPTIELTAEQINSVATKARQNLQNPQKEEEIRQKIQDAGIVQPGFVKIVDSRKTGSADATPYLLTNLPEAPEPGAGLLRETPDLITVAKNEVHPGRGSIRLYVIDPETGNLKYEMPKPDAPKATAKRKNNNMRGMMGMGQGGMMGGQGQGQGNTEKDKAAAKKKQEAAAKDFNRGVAGAVDPDAGKEEEAPVDANLPPGAEYVEQPNGFRWVVLTGVVDNKTLRDNYARALKLDPSGAYVHYLRVDLQRKARLDDGTWTDWEMVDRTYSVEDVLGLRVEEEPETNADNIAFVDSSARLEELCDKLPFLEAGYWVGVYHGDTLNPEILKKKKEDTKGAAGGLAGANMGGGMMDEMAMMGRGGRGGGGGARGPAAGGMGGGMAGMMAGGMGAAGGETGGYGNFFGGGASGGDKDTNFAKSDSDKLMVRALDFTVQPGTSYQYRVRLVVHNPNYGVENVMPGVDRVSKELFGPWSEATTTVSIPPDVQTYVRAQSTPAIRARQPGALTFGVARWNPTDGLTIVKPFEEGIGEIVGEPQGASVPNDDKREGVAKMKQRTIDFTSNRVLVDSSGGSVPVDQLKIAAPGFTLPASALLLRGDGRIELRDEASEEVTGELAEMDAIYRQTLKDAEAGEKKTSNAFGGMGGMGGGMMGMMGAG